MSDLPYRDLAHPFERHIDEGTLMLSKRYQEQGYWALLYSSLVSSELMSGQSEDSIEEAWSRVFGASFIGGAGTMPAYPFFAWDRLASILYRLPDNGRTILDAAAPPPWNVFVDYEQVQRLRESAFASYQAYYDSATGNGVKEPEGETAELLARYWSAVEGYDRYLRLAEAFFPALLIR